ncbi:hypothetical protein [Reichenbachiella versicolor]|uniref:hypothetical protein n=1 Tax=Reichenbachiella versicolor TaxID=1821036 RepID=UPI000D6E4ED4|nr:hypothetical protein [Reichenbachiella versicolor]
MKTTLSLVAFILLSGFYSYSQNRTIPIIDGVYLETDSSFQSLDNTRIVDGAVIAFDIPGIHDYIEENALNMNNISLMMDNIVLQEFPAFMLDRESDLLMYTFYEDQLSTENSLALYQLKGQSEKRVLIGLRFNEKQFVNHHEKVNLYLSQVEKWGTFGYWVIGLVSILFIFLLYKYPSSIKDTLNYSPEQLAKIYGLDEQTCMLNVSYSFSKTQLAFWILVITASAIYIWGFTGHLDSFNSTAFLLLGISAITTGVGVTINQKEDKETNASTSDDQDNSEEHKKLIEFRRSEGFVKDILSDNSGVNLHRLQALIFNIIFAIAFLKTVLIDYQMPDFNETQLALLGLSNGTYAFLKNKEAK